jgi:exodeoxyribonuclease VII large subunit
VLPFVQESPVRLSEAARDQIASTQETLQGVVGRLGRAHPRRRLNESAQRLDDLESSVGKYMRFALSRSQQECMHLSGRLLRSRPQIAVDAARSNVDREEARLFELVQRCHHTLKERLAGLLTRLRLVGPEQVLARGYSITTKASTGEVLTDPSQVLEGNKLTTRLHKGTLTSRVEP